MRQIDYIPFIIDDDYKWVLLVAVIMITHYMALGFFAGSMRKTIFSKEQMQSNFGSLHEAEVGGEIGAGGYPDCGSGRYTFEAGYKVWFEFNNAQRVHLNYAENIQQMLCMMLSAGLYFPRITYIWMAVYMAGRIWYQLGYQLLGPRARLPTLPIVMGT